MDGAGEAPEGAAGCASWAADKSAKLRDNCQNHIQNWLESGVHQAARSAIFQAALGLLKPKLVQPVMVNFMSVGGTLHKAHSQHSLMYDDLQVGALHGLSSISWIWAAQDNTWLLIILTPKGVVFSFLFFSFLFYST